MNCPKCSSPNREDALFCFSCGGSMRPASAPLPAQPPLPPPSAAISHSPPPLPPRPSQPLPQAEQLPQAASGSGPLPSFGETDVPPSVRRYLDDYLVGRFTDVPPTVKRYLDAYRVGRFLDFMGLMTKITGGVLAALVLLLGLLLSVALGNVGSGPRGAVPEAVAAATFAFFLFAVAAVVVFAIIFILGVLISAMGQQLKATLDVAVFSSPFLNRDEKAAAIGLV